MRVIQYSGTKSAQNGGGLPELVTQARGLINAASAAIAASRREPPSTATAMLARKIVSEARKQRPHSLLLQSLDLHGDILDWNDINVAMNLILRALG
jgi:hypothetical protein